MAIAKVFWVVRNYSEHNQYSIG